MNCDLLLREQHGNFWHRSNSVRGFRATRLFLDFLLFHAILTLVDNYAWGGGSLLPFLFGGSYFARQQEHCPFTGNFRIWTHWHGRHT
jgi:hypothetical protein